MSEITSRGPFEYLSELDNISSELENKRGRHIILMIFHDDAFITRDVVDDLEFFLEEHDLSSKGGIDVVLHTLGGDADAAYHIGILLQKLAGERELSFIVPRMAKSAGTLLACSGDKIIMTRISELGPVDPQVYVESARTWVSAKVVRDSFGQTLEIFREKVIRELIDVVRRAPGMSEAVNSVIKPFTEAVLSGIPITELGHYDSLINHARKLLIELLSNKMFKQSSIKSEGSAMQQSPNADSVANTLVSEYSYHGKVIHLDEAKKLGLCVEELSDEEKKLASDLYKTARKFFKVVDELITPMKVIIGRESPITVYHLEHGLVYGPKIEE